MTIYAQITDGVITRTTRGFTAPGYGEDGVWYDFSDPDERNAYLAEHGWHIATEVDRPANTATYTHDLTYELVDGQPTQVWTAREWTTEEADQRAEQAARLDDHEARLRRIEAAVLPAPPDPQDPEDPTVPTWDDLGGVWPNQGLLRDEGKVYRNRSGVPLTTPPSEFPGGPQRWTHLFIEVGATTDPGTGDTPAAWSPDARYEVGDRVIHNGHVWECLIAHGAEYQGTWAPGLAPTVWADLGPAGN